MNHDEQLDILSRRSTVSDAAEVVRSGRLAAVVDDDGSIVGIVGDREMRAAALKGVSDSAAVEHVCGSQFASTAAGASDDVVAASLGDFEEWVVLLDDDRPVGAIARATALGARCDAVRDAVVMVGGQGERLRPLTADVPKPLLPVGGVPILERIVRHLATFGIQRVHLALGYRADQIVNHFGDGAAYGIEVRYIREEKPLGTAGAIGMVAGELEGPVVVMNGDILSEVDIAAMLRAHRREGAAITMAARVHDVQIPYGVVRLLGDRVVSIDEKPVHRSWTNAGIYVIDASVAAEIPSDTYTDMTLMLERLIASGRPLHAFPLLEYWCDIGQIGDYEQANDAVQDDA